MNELALMPKTTLLVSQWLRSRPRVAASVGNRVSYRLGSAYPAIRLTDLGSMQRGPEEALRRVQVECWADDYDTAEDLALAVEAEVPTCRGDWPAGYCAGGGIESGPFANPDTTSQRYRFQLDLALWLYPTPAQP